MQIEHSILRAKQHYNLTLDRNDIEDIVSMIRAGSCKFIRTTINELMVYELKYIKHVRVIYSKKYKNIVTFLPIKKKSKFKNNRDQGKMKGKMNKNVK